MKKLVLFFAVIVAVSFASCKQKTEAPVEEATEEVAPAEEPAATDTVAPAAEAAAPAAEAAAPATK